MRRITPGPGQHAAHGQRRGGTCHRKYEPRRCCRKWPCARNAPCAECTNADGSDRHEAGSGGRSRRAGMGRSPGPRYADSPRWKSFRSLLNPTRPKTGITDERMDTVAGSYFTSGRPCGQQHNPATGVPVDRERHGPGKQALGWGNRMARVEPRSGLSDANGRPVALRPDVILGQEMPRHVAEHQLAR